MSERKVYGDTATMTVVTQTAQQIISQIGIAGRSFPPEIEEQVAIAIIAFVMRHMVAHAEDRTAMTSQFLRALSDGAKMSLE